MILEPGTGAEKAIVHQAVIAEGFLRFGTLFLHNIISTAKTMKSCQIKT